MGRRTERMFGTKMTWMRVVSTCNLQQKENTKKISWQQKHGAYIFHDRNMEFNNTREQGQRHVNKKKFKKKQTNKKQGLYMIKDDMTQQMNASKTTKAFINS
jgi:hypothetical protein